MIIQKKINLQKKSRDVTNLEKSNNFFKSFRELPKDGRSKTKAPQNTQEEQQINSQVENEENDKNDNENNVELEFVEGDQEGEDIIKKSKKKSDGIFKT